MTTLRRRFGAPCAAGLAALITVVGVAAPAASAPAPPAGGGAGTGAPVNLEVLAERYNLARHRAAQADKAVATTRLEMDAVRRRVANLEALTQARAARLYRAAVGARPIAWLDGKSVEEVGRRTRYTEAADAADVELIDELSESLQRLAKQQAEQEEVRDRARREAAAAESARRRLLAEAAAAEARGASGSGDGAGPVGTPRAMRTITPAAAAATQATAPPQTAPPQTAPPQTAPPQTGGPPAPSSRAATAVAFARAQLGKPYVFATSGPNSYDCSGLTMAAWRAAGVSMAHYSGSQATSFPKVSWGQLQPGDIVVFYPDYHHVGLYIGGGQMIHAPQTGDVVKIAPAWRTTFQFGVRPG
jgi:cell wall-associated NlpC family hydrolase